MGACSSKGNSGGKVLSPGSEPTKTPRRHFFHHAAAVDTATIQPPKDPALLDNTILCLPDGAVRAFNLVPNIQDKGAVKNLWFGRAWQLRALEMVRYKHLIEANGSAKKLTHKASKDLEARFRDVSTATLLIKVQKRWKGTAMRRRRQLTCLTPLQGLFGTFTGTVVFMHGSGGMTTNNVRYARKLAGMGFIVIAPDSLAFSEYRHKTLAGIIKPDDPTPYWDDLGVYTSSSQGDGAYSTDASAVLQNPEKWRSLYDSIFRMRETELRWVLGHLPQHIKQRGVFTMGQSEGAMVVARFDDRKYGAMIKGRIISAFSVEYCYFTPEESNGKFGGSPTVPTMNIIGDMDQYFGPNESVAQMVSQDDNSGYGSKVIKGHAFENMKSQKIERGLVAVLEGAEHDASVTHDNMLRDLLQGFLSAPGECNKIVDRWKPDNYLSRKVKVLETDGHRMLIRIGKDDFPSTLPYPRVVLCRQVIGFLSDERKLEMMENWERANLLAADAKKKSAEMLLAFKQKTASTLNGGSRTPGSQKSLKEDPDEDEERAEEQRIKEAVKVYENILKADDGETNVNVVVNMGEDVAFHEEGARRFPHCWHC